MPRGCCHGDGQRCRLSTGRPAVPDTGRRDRRLRQRCRCMPVPVPGHPKTLLVELDGSVIGDLLISVQDAWAQDEVAEQARGVQANLGCGLHPAHNGHGYAIEAVGEVLRLCFDELRLRRVTADCFADNTASRRLMERVGMRREAYTVRDSLHRSGAWLDGIAYALLQEEWEQASGNCAATT